MMPRMKFWSRDFRQRMRWLALFAHQHASSGLHPQLQALAPAPGGNDEASNAK